MERCVASFFFIMVFLTTSVLAHASHPGLSLGSCPDGYFGEDVPVHGVQCGSLEVFENRTAQSGRRIKIHFVVISSELDTSGKEKKPPFVYLEGGPGFSSISSPVDWRNIAGSLLTQRDFILLDYRGIGRSNGLSCEHFGPVDQYQTFVTYWTPEEIQACSRKLAKVADLTQYTTAEIAKDIDEVLSALGHKRYALFGASYGTRVAQEILRRHGNHIELAVLDGVVPPSLRMSLIPRNVENTWDRLVEKCAVEPVCNSVAPNLEAAFQKLLLRLRKGPIAARVRHMKTGKIQEVTFNYDEFVVELRNALHFLNNVIGLPRSITQAANGSYEPLLQILADSAYQKGNPDDGIYFGTYLSLICSEAIDYLDWEQAASETKNTLLGMSSLSRLHDICDLWPKGRIPEDFHDPLVSDVPVLIVSGELDPVTTPSDGDLVARTLSNSLHLVLANRVHTSSDPEGWNCERSVMERFYVQSTLDGLDLTCGSRLKPPEWQ